MNSALTVTGQTDREQLNGVSSRKGSDMIATERPRDTAADGAHSPSENESIRPSTPMERVACTGKQMKYQKAPEGNFFSKLTRKTFELDGERSDRSDLRLPSTRVTVYPQREITSSWKGRRDFSLPRLDVLKVQLEARWAEEEHGQHPKSLSVPGSAWSPAVPRDLDFSRTRSADSYFRRKERLSGEADYFQTQMQMKRAFNTFVKSHAQTAVPPARPNTSVSTYSRQSAASPNVKEATGRIGIGNDNTTALAWYSAPNRQRVVRKSPPWRSLMNRRPQGIRSDDTNLCPYHCRCCFTEVNDTEGCSVYKLDFGTL